MNLASYETLLHNHETELRAYGSFEKLREYLNDAEHRKHYYVQKAINSAEASNNGKPLSTTKLRQIETVQEKYILKLLDDKLIPAVNAAINHAKLKDFISQSEQELGLVLVGTGEAANIFEMPTEDCRMVLYRVRKRNEIKSVCFKPTATSSGHWFWDKTVVQELAIKRKLQQPHKRQQEQERQKIPRSPIPSSPPVIVYDRRHLSILQSIPNMELVKARVTDKPIA